MKISVILAHPNKESFNHAIAATVVETLKQSGHEVFFHDLYEEKFDPLLSNKEIPKTAPRSPDIDKYCEEIAEAEGIVVVHPNWWGQQPAILKGWVDRVFRPGVAYEFLEGANGIGIQHGLLKAKAAVVFNTSNTPMERERQVFGDPLETIWKNVIFGVAGVENFYRKMFNIIIISSEEQRKGWLKEVRQTVLEYFPKK